MPKITNPGNIPAVDIEQFKITYFRGVDLTNQPAGVDDGRACDGTNMIRDVPGYVRKRMGYFLANDFGSRINGIHSRRGEIIVHSGTNIYKIGDKDSPVYTGAADEKSYSVQFGDYLLLLDGSNFILYDGETIKSVSDGAYVPTITLGRTPSGGGTAFEPVNMLQPKRTDSFLGTESDTVYQLSFNEISESAVTARKMTAAETWEDLTENDDFSVDRTTGKVTFNTAPGVSPVTGEDNITITYSVQNDDYINRVNKCRFMIVYGAYGATDRVFISGNPDYPNYDFYSQINDATYFGDIWYGVLGQEHSPVTGYSIINNKLATHKKNDDNERNIFLRYGEIDTNEEPENDGTIFSIVDIIQGPGAITPYAFGYAKEPMFLTNEGICATTPYEYNSERYVQNRSFFLNGALTLENGLDMAVATVFRELYLLAVNGRVYILDTMQPAANKGSRSEYQYEGYLWDNIDARVLFNDGEHLYFGDNSGSVFEFYTDPKSLLSYNDNGQPIKARWDFDFSGENFYLKKRIRYIAVRMYAAAATSVDIWCRIRGIWKFIANSGAKARYLSFSNLQFSKITFSSDTNPRTIGQKQKIKKIDAARFSFRNEVLNEPFGLFELALQFSEKGFYRR